MSTLGNAPIQEAAGDKWSRGWTNFFTQLVKIVNNLSTNLNSKADISTVATKADDAAVVHLAGTETITGPKTFSTSPVLPTPLTADNSTKGATTAWVRNQGYGTGNGTITGVAATRIVFNGTDIGAGERITGVSLEVTGTSIRVVETHTYN